MSQRKGDSTVPLLDPMQLTDDQYESFVFSLVKLLVGDATATEWDKNGTVHQLSIKVNNCILYLFSALIKNN